METLFFSALMALHVVAGGTALLSMWIPMLTRKGGTAHRRAGWVYTGAMGVVAVTGAGLAGEALASGRIRRGGFLLFIALLSATNTWLGVRALSRRTTKVARALDVVFPAALTAASVGLGIWGAVTSSVLFGGFAVLGFVLGASQLRTWAVPAATRADRALRHVGGMGASCIATVTAFLVVNANRIGFGGSVLPWFLPAIVGGVLLTWRKRRIAVGAPHAG